jgi:hypothetical protein
MAKKLCTTAIALVKFEPWDWYPFIPLGREKQVRLSVLLRDTGQSMGHRGI